MAPYPFSKNKRHCALYLSLSFPGESMKHTSQCCSDPLSGYLEELWLVGDVKIRGSSLEPLGCGSRGVACRVIHQAGPHRLMVSEVCHGVTGKLQKEVLCVDPSICSRKLTVAHAESSSWCALDSEKQWMPGHRLWRDCVRAGAHLELSCRCLAHGVLKLGSNVLMLETKHVFEAQEGPEDTNTFCNKQPWPPALVSCGPLIPHVLFFKNSSQRVKKAHGKWWYVCIKYQWNASRM